MIKKIVLGTLAVFGIVVVSTVGGVSWLLYTQHVEVQKEANERKRVVAAVTYDTKNCDPEYPLRVGVYNNSSRTVSAIDLTLEARRPNHSTNLVSSLERDFKWDRVLAPSAIADACYRLPESLTTPEFREHYGDPVRLEYSVEPEYGGYGIEFSGH